MKLFNANPPAIVQQAEETEEQLIERAQASLSSCNWTIGECAFRWTQKYAKGRTDADFGTLVGFSQPEVNIARRIYEKFGERYRNFYNLKWFHFSTALHWDDAVACLDWASENDATVAEMKAWRRAQHGEDLSEPADETQSTESQAPENNPVVTTKKRAVAPTETIPGGVESQTDRSPVRAKQEHREGSGGEDEPAESRNSGESPPPRPVWNCSRLINDLFTLEKECFRNAEPDEQELIADQLQSWLWKIRPPKTVTTPQKKFTPPTVEEVARYCAERNNEVDAEAFVSHYQSNGWKVGKNPMKDWKAAVITWEKSAKERRTPVSRGAYQKPTVTEHNKAAFDAVFGPEDPPREVIDESDVPF
ncbi:hypothetical protein [Planctomicrobium piriforme]|uniref:Uncharacterized protein n=1 Tax=Planctomicrobium piriforme TaxID=1576369 RepID=A0A1I3EHR3_9PLAN|nr:hypothetical protein [Planctomicrobium piriforme]SFH98502.1 hypothetical protein SAMN05421753_104228 [Planctomicrobium piriforme]